MDHGADGARLLSQTLSDNMYAGSGENPIRRHLLSRSRLPDLGPALVGAFRGQRLALARAFVARGADTAVLGDWVEDDLVTPATIEVRYQASEQEQQVTLALVLRRLQPDYPAQVSSAFEIARPLVRLGGLCARSFLVPGPGGRPLSAPAGGAVHCHLQTAKEAVRSGRAP